MFTLLFSMLLVDASRSKLQFVKKVLFWPDMPNLWPEGQIQPLRSLLLALDMIAYLYYNQPDKKINK